MLATFVKSWLIPGSMSFLLAAVAVGAVLLNAGPWALVFGRVWLTGLALLYWVLSLPVVASALITRMGRRYTTIRQREEAIGADVLVVVGNGSVHYTDGTFGIDYLTRRSVFCVFEAARLQALLAPHLVITTGGVAGDPRARPEAVLMRDLLVERGVPDERIVVEAHSRSTHEQVTNVMAMLVERGLAGPLVVVTTTAHMPRVAALFAARGARIVPSVTPELRYDNGLTGWRRWWPAMSALTGSASALYELMAGVRSALQLDPR